VIGVNSQIATAGAQGSVGIGFAVPSNTVREVVPKLRDGETIERPYLGVTTSPAPGSGAAVESVEPGGPGADAGIRDGARGDVIVGIEGRSIGGPEDVSKAIEDREPGDTIEVTVERDGRRVSLDVELGERPRRSSQPGP
jgi:putative serine protease PepD